VRRWLPLGRLAFAAGVALAPISLSAASAYALAATAGASGPPGHRLHAPAPAKPSLTAIPPAARPGATVFVDATHFPHDVDVFLQICGDAGLYGSSGCDQVDSSTVATSSTGTFRWPILVERPPLDCPCVVEAFSPSLQSPVLLPFKVVGVPIAPLQRYRTSNPFDALSISGVALTGSGPWTSWFGGQPRRTIVLTLTNRGSVKLTLPPMVVREGAVGTTPLDVATPALGSLGPHRSRVVRIGVSFRYFASGSFDVSGYFAGLASPRTRFTLKTSMFPWGALILAILLGLILLGTAIYVVISRRRRRRNDDDGGRDAPAPGGDEGATSESQPTGPDEGGTDDPDAVAPPSTDAGSPSESPFEQLSLLFGDVEGTALSEDPVAPPEEVG